MFSYPVPMHPRTPDQPSPEDRPVSGVRLVTDVVDALMQRGGPPGYRVVYRTNPKGEHVVAVIWPPSA
jgi:hypothetical protein